MNASRRKYFTLLSMTSKVIEGHKRSLFKNLTYVLMDNFCPCFLQSFNNEVTEAFKVFC